jgi:hypothetical protein
VTLSKTEVPSRLGRVIRREYVPEAVRRNRMRTVLLSSFLVLATACSSSTSGGRVSLSFGDAGASAAVFTTTPAGAAMIPGEFSASGDFEGQYTLATSVPSGSPLASCLVSVDEGTPGTSVQVDASSSQAHSVTVEIALGTGYQGQGVCNVAATNNAKPNVGDTVIIQVGAAGDAG